MILHVFAGRVAEGHSNDEVIDVLPSPPRAPFGDQAMGMGGRRRDLGSGGKALAGVFRTDVDTREGSESHSNDPFHADAVERLLPRFAAGAVVDSERRAA